MPAVVELVQPICSPRETVLAPYSSALRCVEVNTGAEVVVSLEAQDMDGPAVVGTVAYGQNPALEPERQPIPADCMAGLR